MEKGRRVAVMGKTRPVRATWNLLIDGEESDTAKATGDFILKGILSNGLPVEAAVHQKPRGAD